MLQTLCDAVNTHTVGQVGCKWRSAAVSQVYAKLRNCCQPRPVSFVPDKQRNLRERNTDEWKRHRRKKNSLHKLLLSLYQSQFTYFIMFLWYTSICTWLQATSFTWFWLLSLVAGSQAFVTVWQIERVSRILLQHLSGDQFRITANAIVALLLST